MDIDKLFRGHARLNALRKNLDEKHDQHERYVKEYHDILVQLEGVMSGTLNEFRVPDSEMKHEWTGYTQVGGNSFSQEKYCAGRYMCAKVDGLINYLAILLHKEAPEMGFQVA